MLRRLPPALAPSSLAEVAAWGSGLLVLAAGWAAGRGVAAGMDTPHCAAAGFAVSGSIFLAVALRERRGAPAQGRAH